MDIAIGLTVMFFVVLPILGLILGSGNLEGKVIGFLLGVFYAFDLSIVVWVVYVVAHFVAKFW
jgi:hypothetical protein